MERFPAAKQEKGTPAKVGYRLRLKKCKVLNMVAGEKMKWNAQAWAQELHDHQNSYSHAAFPHSCPCPLQPPTLTVLLSSHHSRALQMPYPMPCEHFEIERIFPHLKFNFLLRTEKSSGSETEGFILQIENRNG